MAYSQSLSKLYQWLRKQRLETKLYSNAIASLSNEFKSEITQLSKSISDPKEGQHNSNTNMATSMAASRTKTYSLMQKTSAKKEERLERIKKMIKALLNCSDPETIARIGQIEHDWVYEVRFVG